MTQVVADISMSLDGFVTGPDVSLTNGMGTGGEALHQWAFSDDPDEKRLLSEGTERSGVVIMGRRLFDIIDGPDGWSEDVGYGAREVGKPPFIVVTHEPPTSVRLSGLDWTFASSVVDGVATARGRAEALSAERGKDLDVVIMGGGDVISAAVAAGLVDILSVHLAPVLLGTGTPLFSDGTSRALVQLSAVMTPNATHLVYGVA